MTERSAHITDLIIKYLRSELTASEAATLQEWRSASPLHEQEFHDLTDARNTAGRLKLWRDYDNKYIAAELQQRFAGINLQEIPEASNEDSGGAVRVHRVHFLKTAWFRYAAAVVALFGIGFYLWNNKSTNASATERTAINEINIPPGGQGAILILGDGRRLVLDSLTNGVIASENGTQIVLKNGLLTYNKGISDAGDVVYNTMQTPKGRQFQLALPDGSKVWLNAQSSIKYPAVFTAKERLVEIDGEAYFEIAKNADRPFKVKVNDETVVEVLGTSFNINSYENEPSLKTTLVEGSVRVNAYKQLQALKPGQEAIVTSSGKLEVAVADVEKALAWKNGFFNFDNATLEEVMKHLERWYDIEVAYEHGVPDIRFMGKMSRNVTFSDILDGLKGAGVKFRIENQKQIIIMR